MVRYALLLLMLFASQTSAASERLTVCSPDGQIAVDMWIDANGTPYYEVRRGDLPVIAPSRLGFQISASDRAIDASRNFVVMRHEQNRVNQVWVQSWGESREVRDMHRELAVTLRHAGDKPVTMRVVWRVFNDGVAFRYEFPRQSNLRRFSIADEVTEFVVAPSAKAWWIPAFDGLRFEYLYQSTPLGEVNAVHTPLTCELANGLAISIHEAALVDYASMALKRVEGQTLKADLVPWSDGVRVRATAPLQTPWRTIQIAEKPIELLASNLILNLNEPCKLEDTSWIRPGKYVGVWWEMHVGRSTWGSGETHGAKTDNVKQFIDFAAKYGFDGVLVEGWNEGWDGDWMGNGRAFEFAKPYADFDFEYLSRYARERNVFIIGHHETAGDIRNYERQLDAAMQLYQKLGVPAVKTGYVAFGQGIKRHDADGAVHNEWHHGQFMVRHHAKVAEVAAKHRVAVFAHEPVKDTGLRRTWPHIMSREGARGQEYNAWSGDGGNPPDHTTILPYTRMLSGPMDFTPGVFDVLLSTGDRPNNRVNTTLAKQLALYVVIYSPFHMAVDFPEVYEQHLDAFQFIRDVPTDWHETRPLAGQIGDFVVIARRERDGDQWYLGAITDEQPRSVEVSLEFLKPHTTYRAEIYRDADGTDWQTNPMGYAIESREVDAHTTLTIDLPAGGGQAMRFVPEQASK